jgi:Pvc16 N-terminal domain
MALLDSGRAIGAATRLLQDQLIRRGFEVAVGRPEVAARDNTVPKLNLFLFETDIDPQMRNLSLSDGESPPLWLVLRYLLTAFENGDSSDSAVAHELLGRGLAALQEMSYLRLDAGVPLADSAALEHNPEPLKLTLDSAPSDLLAKVMQGSDERYRLSAAFQLRPIMIAPARAPRASLLVGVDYSQPTQTEIGAGGIGIAVQPTLGPQLSRVVPARFEAGATVDVIGTDLFGADLEVVLGTVILTVLERRPDRLRARIEGAADGGSEELIAGGSTVSAGELPLIVRKRLSPTRARSSNLLAPQLLPTLRSARFDSSDLVLEGTLLGRASDDVIVSFCRESDGQPMASLDVFEATADQHTLIVPNGAKAVPAGNYRVVLRVNNQQARSSPLVTVT